MLRRFRLLPLFLPLLALSAGDASGVELPDQASDEAHAHVTHGPDGLALDGRGRPAPVAATYAVDNHAEWLACEYDGQVLLEDYLAATPGQDETLPQVHAIYVYPAKTTSRFPQFAAMFQADARQASALVQTLGADVRWDVRPDLVPAATCPSEGRRTTMLDITVFQSKYSARQLGTDRQFSLVAAELAASPKFPSSTKKKYIAWLDAGSNYCGQGTLWQDTTRRVGNTSDVNRTTGIVYRPYTPISNAANGGFCRGRTLLHELGHNLGAVQKVAPHAFDGAHCNDDKNDTMCYVANSSATSGVPPQFDFNKDDYWDPAAAKLTWWTLNLSRYICPLGTGTTPDCTKLNAPSY